jgi:hypothetical protein
MGAAAYSAKQRQLAEKRLADGEPATAVARQLNLHIRTVARWRDGLGIKPHPWGWPVGRSRKKEGK